MQEKTPEEIEAHRKLVKKLVVQALRQMSYRFPARSDAIKAARVGRGLYKCNDCGDIVKNKCFKVDHIFPVIDPEKGFIDWNTYIDRMLPMSDMYQILCFSCHDKKTRIENSIRKVIRASKKVALDKTKKV